MTAVHEVIRCDNVDLFKCIYPLLKDYKRELSVTGSFGFMHIAASCEGTKCLTHMLDQGEFPNQTCNAVD